MLTVIMESVYTHLTDTHGFRRVVEWPIDFNQTSRLATNPIDMAIVKHNLHSFTLATETNSTPRPFATESMQVS